MKTIRNYDLLIQFSFSFRGLFLENTYMIPGAAYLYSLAVIATLGSIVNLLPSVIRIAVTWHGYTRRSTLTS